MIALYNRKITAFFFEFKTNNIALYSQLIAGFALVNILIIFPDIFDLYSTYGYVNSAINNQFVNWFEPSLSSVLSWLESVGFYKNVALLVVIIGYVLSLFFILTRYQPFLFSVIAWIMHVMMVNSSYYFSYGADFFITFILFANILFNVDKVSLKTTTIQTIQSFTIRFIQIQLCMVYFFAGFGKIVGIDWINGDAIWYVLHAFAPEVVAQQWFDKISIPILFMGIAWVTLLTELCYPIFIFYSKTKKITLFSVIAMHLGIFIFLKLYTFAFIMILLNIIAFGHYLTYPAILRKKILFKKWSVMREKLISTP